MSIGNMDSLNFLNLQVRYLGCRSGSGYMVFLTPKLRYSLTVQLLLWYFDFLKVQLWRDCGSGSEYSVSFYMDILKFLNLQAQDLDCGSGSDNIDFFIPRLRYFLKVQWARDRGSGSTHSARRVSSYETGHGTGTLGSGITFNHVSVPVHSSEYGYGLFL